jgi:hypothetical protein
MPTDTQLYHDLIRSAAARLTGHERRAYIAEVTQTLCNGSARRSERLFGWRRETAQTGMLEDEFGIHCVEHFRERGRVRSEDADPRLAQSIRDLADPHTQADPQMQSALRYTRLTAQALRQALIDEKGFTSEQLPSLRSLRRILNRMGYRLRRIQKTKPLKKVPETDAIFANVEAQHQKAVQEPESTLEISIDVKAKVDVGEFSRGGETRCDSEGKTPAALDHDYRPAKKGCPSGS